MKTSSRLMAAGILLIGSLIVAPAAYAGLSNQSFGTELPNLQQPRFVGNQTKTYGSSPGWVSITNVGSAYTVNVRMSRSSPRSYGTEVFGLNDGTAASLPNSYSAGTTRLQAALVNSTWTHVKVSVSGSWRSS